MKFSRLLSRTLSLAMAAALIVMAPGSAEAVDIANGKKLAKKCQVCHTLEKGGKNKLGPNLYGIIGSDSASVPGYKYSDAMKNSGVIWDGGTFKKFITKPRKFIKGTKMSFKGIKKANQRLDLLAYFETLHDVVLDSTHVGDPAAGAIAAIKHCTACHSFTKGGNTIFGPNLWGSYGAKAGEEEGYNYSDVLKNSGIFWTDANIIGFLADPKGFLPGTKAQFPGVKNPDEIVDILAYMKTLK